MSESSFEPTPPARPGPARRKALSLAPTTLVTEGPLDPAWDLPWLIQPAVPGVQLATWAAAQRDYLQARLVEWGAILFRGFPLTSVADFEQVATAISGDLIDYRFRASPRSEVGNKVYTSTDYPAEYSIYPHNEHAYSPVFPTKLFFFCVTPAQAGGATPIGSNRRILSRIDPAIRDRFVAKQILYVRNYGDGFGLPWQTVFQTTERAAVEAYCQAHGIEWVWKAGDRLMTRQVGPAMLPHPVTGEQVWFNHGTFFHVTTLAPSVRDGLLAAFAEEDLPNNTYYGDGTPIEPAVLDHLRAAYDESLVAFPWQAGDLLLVDNMLAVHGRAPFVGPRRVVVAMTEPLSSRGE